MSELRPYVLCISGYDPSGGAGMLADIKTLEMHRVQGLGVCTAITYQNEDEFLGMEWLSQDSIMQQLKALISHYSPVVVKVGIVESLELLDTLITVLKEKFPDVKIVWDPVLNASAGFDFLNKPDHTLFSSILKKIDLITPNLPESELLFGSQLPSEIVKQSQCPVLLKGGHSEDEYSIDTLLFNGDQIQFSHKKKTGFSKHGTGCILSSAIAANLALGKSLPDACRAAKEYIQPILTSNTTRLAYHYE